MFFSFGLLMNAPTADFGLVKRPQLWASCCFWTGKKVAIVFVLSPVKFLYWSRMDLFDVWVKAELRLSHIWNGRSKKSLETSGYCRRETIVCVLKSLLCKVLLSFDNARQIDSAVVFLGSCKLGHARHPLYCYLTRRHLITGYFCLLSSEKKAPFLTKKHCVDYFVNWKFFTFRECFLPVESLSGTIPRVQSSNKIKQADFQFLLSRSSATCIINPLPWTNGLNNFCTLTLIFPLKYFLISSSVLI